MADSKGSGPIDWIGERFQELGQALQNAFGTSAPPAVLPHAPAETPVPAPAGGSNNPRFRGTEIDAIQASHGFTPLPKGTLNNLFGDASALPAPASHPSPQNSAPPPGTPYNPDEAERNRLGRAHAAIAHQQAPHGR